jgi:hypothetical protein
MTDPNGWHDAGRSAYWAFERLSEAKTIGEQGDAFNDLSNAMSDLVSWLPGWDWERGVLNTPATREEDPDGR